MILAATSEGDALKAASGSNTSPISPTTAQPPSMRGYLSKWTNMARGYRSRWFVLDNGELNKRISLQSSTNLISFMN